MKDQILCELELRQTASELALEHLELRRRAVETTLARFKKLYDNSPVGFITFDHLGHIIDINHAAVRLLKITPTAVLGLSMTVLIADKSCANFMDHLRKSRRAAGGPVMTEVEMIGGDNSKIAVQIVTSALMLDTGRLFETAILDRTAQKAAADAITRAREYAESIVSTIPYPLLVLDRRARVVGANAAFYYRFQTSERQVINWPIAQLPEVTWLTADLDKILIKALTEDRPIDGSLIRAEIKPESLLTLHLSARKLASPRDSSDDYLLVAFEDITKRQRAEEERELLLTELQESQARLETRVTERTHELTQSYSQLRTMGEQLVLAHESEQRRIARELHDQIGQDLTALKIALSRGKTGNLDEARKTLREAEALTEEILQTVRNICSTLRPQVLDDLGLVAGLKWHVKTFGERTGLKIRFVNSLIEEDRLSPIVQSTIFRVIQEALTNVSRHADARTAEMSLAMHDGSVEFSVHDRGKGFEIAAVKKGSTGLSSMRERLSLVQGSFEIVSSPGQGTVIKARIPVPAKTSNHSETDRIEHGQESTNQNRSSRRSPSRAQGAQVPARE